MDTMLTVTHRLNQPLCQWPSESFYLSRLQSSPHAAKRRFVLGDCGSEFREMLAAEPSVVWAAVPHQGSRSSSPEEIEVIAGLLLAIREAGASWSDVGIVVPFRRQARLLRQRLFRVLKSSPSAAGLVADTVERMQGQEREIVIVSFTTSDPLFAERLAEFLFQPERLNVAATRPRTKLILVASPDLLEFAGTSRMQPLSAPFLSLFQQGRRMDVGVGT
jgi:DNA replication ATP-dependent helicase Dna2